MRIVFGDGPRDRELQWGRGLLAAEIGPRSQECCARDSLQWGRGLLAAEMPQPMSGLSYAPGASMGPRLVSRGNPALGRRYCPAHTRFNGAPRLVSPGNNRTTPNANKTAAASIGPRLGIRENKLEKL